MAVFETRSALLIAKWTQPAAHPLRLWWRALSVKRPQAVLALISLLVGAAVMSMLLNLYGGVRRKMTQEFRGYGANVILAPGSSASFTPTGDLVSSPRPCHPERSEGSLQFAADASANGNCGDSSPAKGGGLRMTGSNSPDSPTNERNPGWGGTMDQAIVNSVHQLAGKDRGVTALPVLYAVVRLERIPPDPILPDFVNVVAVGTDLAGDDPDEPGLARKQGERRPPGRLCSCRAWLARALPRAFELRRATRSTSIRWPHRTPEAPKPPSIAALLQCSGLAHRKRTRFFFPSTSCKGSWGCPADQPGAAQARRRYARNRKFNSRTVESASRGGRASHSPDCLLRRESPGRHSMVSPGADGPDSRYHRDMPYGDDDGDRARTA